MKALETIKGHIKDLERLEDVFTFYGCFSSATDCKKANKELTEAVAELEAQLKAKDEEIRRLNNLYADTIKDLGDALIEIERLKEIINTSIEEIEYALIKSQYVEVYLNNAIRFLKDNE